MLLNSVLGSRSRFEQMKRERYMVNNSTLTRLIFDWKNFVICILNVNINLYECLGRNSSRHTSIIFLCYWSWICMNLFGNLNVLCCWNRTSLQTQNACSCWYNDLNRFIIGFIGNMVYFVLFFIYFLKYSTYKMFFPYICYVIILFIIK